jgi:hypothetical protein
MTNTLRDELALLLYVADKATYEEKAQSIIDHITPTLREVEEALEYAKDLLEALGSYSDTVDDCVQECEQTLTKLSALLGKGDV